MASIDSAIGTRCMPSTSPKEIPGVRHTRGRSAGVRSHSGTSARPL
jgi:hypothetical protein